MVLLGIFFANIMATKYTPQTIKNACFEYKCEEVRTKHRKIIGRYHRWVPLIGAGHKEYINEGNSILYNTAKTKHGSSILHVFFHKNLKKEYFLFAE